MLQISYTYFQVYGRELQASSQSEEFPNCIPALNIQQQPSTKCDFPSYQMNENLFINHVKMARKKAHTGEMEKENFCRRWERISREIFFSPFSFASLHPLFTHFGCFYLRYHLDISFSSLVFFLKKDDVLFCIYSSWWGGWLDVVLMKL